MFTGRYRTVRHYSSSIRAFKWVSESPSVLNSSFANCSVSNKFDFVSGRNEASSASTVITPGQQATAMLAQFSYDSRQLVLFPWSSSLRLADWRNRALAWIGGRISITCAVLEDRGGQTFKIVIDTLPHRMPTDDGMGEATSWYSIFWPHSLFSLLI